jgi:hypothetical protein
MDLSYSTVLTFLSVGIVLSVLWGILIPPMFKRRLGRGGFIEPHVESQIHSHKRPGACQYNGL